jgi:hypothetical protein
MTLYILKPGFTNVVSSSGLSVQIADPTIGSKGGFVVNPLSAQDQGITVPESLWINLVSGAVPSAVSGSTELLPGQAFLVPNNCNVWVTALTPGHKFTSIFTSEYTVPYPPGIVPGIPGSGTGAVFGGYTGGKPFPPETVTGLQTVIPSYLYQEYSDDDDCQGFVDAQNDSQQDYVDTFNALNLPIYTGQPSLVAGQLLDWVGTGVYGMSRPALTSGRPLTMGPLNTWGYNWLFPMWGVPPAGVEVEFGLNMLQLLSVGEIIITDDDLYRRILTWHLYKGDGNYFSIPWLKRRVWRFLYGTDGTAPESVDWWPNDASIADMEQISCSIGVDQNVTIRFILGKRPVHGGAMLNTFGCNGFQPGFGVVPPWNIGDDIVPVVPGTTYPTRGITPNDLETTYTPLLPLPYMSTFKAALDSGVLEFPYHFNFTSQIG